MDDDLVMINLICDELEVPRGEALYYLEGFEWNMDSAMEACRSKTLPLPSVRVKSLPSIPSMVTDSRSILNPPAEKQHSRLKNQHIEAFCNVSLDSQRVSGDESSEEEECPLVELSYLHSQFHASVGHPKQDYLKQVKVESSASSQSWPPIILNSMSPSRKLEPPSSRETDTTDPPLQGISRKPEEQLIDNSQRESDIITDSDATLSVVIVSPTHGGRTTTQENLQQPGDAANQFYRNRWSAYVKSCNEMIAFLTAAALAFVPIRYLIDAQNKCGGRLQVTDYLELLLRFFEDFTLVDPFIIFALGYATSYIFSSASFPRRVVQMGEAVSIFCGFGVVFSVIFYTSQETFYAGIASFGLFIGALTVREFRLARSG